MTNILCVDPTSAFCSVSLFNGYELVNSVNSKIERSHSKLIISLVDKVIKEGKAIILDAHYVPHFKPSKILVDLVKENNKIV